MRYIVAWVGEIKICPVPKLRLDLVPEVYTEMAGRGLEVDTQEAWLTSLYGIQSWPGHLSRALLEWAGKWLRF